MGYAERSRRWFWWSLWSLPWWRRLPYVWTIVSRPGRLARVARFRGQFWKWCRGVRVR